MHFNNSNLNDFTKILNSNNINSVFRANNLSKWSKVFNKIH